MRILPFLMLTLLAACADEAVQPEVQEARGRHAVALFAQSCVAHNGAAAEISAWAESSRAKRATVEDIKRLPFSLIEPDVQSLWQVVHDDAVYYVSLTGDSCSVKAERADEQAVRQAFTALVMQVPKGVNAEMRADQATQTPFPFRQLVYAWRAEGSGDETVLSANTSISRQLPAQAVLSLTHKSYRTNAPVLVP